jgi:putative MATE family efflux protein
MQPAQSMIVDHTRIGAALRRLSLPLALQMLGDQLLSTVDTIVIGTFGPPALAGVTAAITVFFTLVLLIAGLWSGMGIIAAQRIGAHDVDGFARTVRAGFIVPAIASIAVMCISIGTAEPLLRAMLGATPVLHASALYLILRCASLVPINVSATLIVGLSSAGNRKLGVYILGIINLIHLPLLFVLALGWLTHRPFGIAGAGVSTLFSETCAAIFAVIYVARKPIYRIFAQRSIDLRLALQCAWLGLPESVFGGAIVGPDVAIVAMLAHFGPLLVAGFRAINVVSDLTFVVPSPLQNATQTVIGQRIGARDPEGARSFLHRALRTTLVVTTLTGAIVAALAWPLSYLFTMSALVASVAAAPLALHMVTMPIKGWAMVALAPIRAAGDTRFSMAVGLACGVLVLPIAWYGIERLHIGLFAVPIAWIIAWSARAAITVWKLRTADYGTPIETAVP